MNIKSETFDKVKKLLKESMDKMLKKTQELDEPSPLTFHQAQMEPTQWVGSGTGSGFAVTGYGSNGVAGNGVTWTNQAGVYQSTNGVGWGGFQIGGTSAGTGSLGGFDPDPTEKVSLREMYVPKKVRCGFVPPPPKLSEHDGWVEFMLKSEPMAGAIVYKDCGCAWKVMLDWQGVLQWVHMHSCGLHKHQEQYEAHMKMANVQISNAKEYFDAHPEAGEELLK